jgi:hypothetical protein
MFTFLSTITVAHQKFFCWIFTHHVITKYTHYITLLHTIHEHLHLYILWNSVVIKYEVVSKILRNGATIYTAVVVARSTGPNRPNCEFRVLLRRFTATAWKHAKTSPWTLARTDLAASPWQQHISHHWEDPGWITEFLTRWQKRTSRNHSKNERECGTSVYMLERTTLRVMAVNRPYGEFYDF